MVALTRRFALLAAFCLLAAVSNAAVVAPRAETTSLETSHTSKGAKSTGAPVLDLPERVKSGAGKTSKKAKSKAEPKSKPKDEDQDTDKKPVHETANVEGGGDGKKEKHTSKAKHHQSRHEHYCEEHPCWDGIDIEANVVIKRDPHHHHDGHGKIVVAGNDDHVHVERDDDKGSAMEGGDGVRVPDLPGGILSRHHGHDRHRPEVIVKGKDDHVHYDRVPHHHDGHRKIVIAGDDEHVHVDREPHHHDGHRKVVITGNDDHVHVDRAPEPHHDHHHKVVITGDDDHVHIDRAPGPHHDHHKGHEKVVVAGKDDHVHVDRAPEPHHGHHKGDDHHRVIVTGDDAHVHIGRDQQLDAKALHRRWLESGRTPHRRNGNAERGRSREIKNVYYGSSERRDMGIDGVPGTVDIMSKANGTRIASLILESGTPGQSNSTSGNTTNTQSKEYFLDASEMNSTTLYLVDMDNQDPGVSDGEEPTSNTMATSSGTMSVTSSDNSTLAGGSFNGTSYNITSPSNGTFAMAAAADSIPDAKNVALQIAMFDADAAAMKPYCATYEQNTQSREPLTVEPCFDTAGMQGGMNKSQAFVYLPGTGEVKPNWDSSSTGNGTGPDASSGNSTSTLGSRASKPKAKVDKDVMMVFNPSAPIAMNVEGDKKVTEADVVSSAMWGSGSSTRTASAGSGTADPAATPSAMDDAMNAAGDSSAPSSSVAFSGSVEWYTNTATSSSSPTDTAAGADATPASASASISVSSATTQSDISSSTFSSAAMSSSSLPDASYTSTSGVPQSTSSAMESQPSEEPNAEAVAASIAAVVTMWEDALEAAQEAEAESQDDGASEPVSTAPAPSSTAMDGSSPSGTATDGPTSSDTGMADGASATGGVDAPTSTASDAGAPGSTGTASDGDATGAGAPMSTAV